MKFYYCQLTLPSEEGQAVAVPLVIQVFQLLPGGGAEALGQAVEVGRTQLHGLVAEVDHVLGAGLPLGADVAEPGEGTDCDDVGVRDAGDVAGEASITASLHVQRLVGGNGAMYSELPLIWTPKTIPL